MSALFAGIDGGQSSTVAMIGDERGRILGRGAAGPCDEVGENSGSTKLAEALRGALFDAAKNARLSEETRFASIVAAISGYEGRIYGVAPQLPGERLKIVHDAPAAHAGAFGSDDGVVVIAGTGSVVYARDTAGAEVTCGGWGYLFGDEGSAFWIAREALCAMMLSQDMRSEGLDEEQRVALRFFGARTLRDLTRRFYAGEISRERIAAFAPSVLQFKELEPIERGARRLSALALAALDALRLNRVALVGGAVREPRYYDAIAAPIREGCPHAKIVDAKYEPVAGALLLAYREAALPVRDLVNL